MTPLRPARPFRRARRGQEGVVLILTLFVLFITIAMIAQLSVGSSVAWHATRFRVEKVAMERGAVAFVGLTNSGLARLIDKAELKRELRLAKASVAEADKVREPAE